MSTPNATAIPAPAPAALPAVVRHTIRFGLPAALLAAAALSFQGLYALARAVGWAPEVAWLLPVSVDLAAAIGTVVWLGIPAAYGDARRHAAKTAVTAITLTVLGNGVSHLIEAHILPVTWIVIVVVTSVPPVVVALLVHLGMSLPHTAPEPVGDKEEQPEAGAASHRTITDAVAIATQMLKAEQRAGRNPAKLTSTPVAARLECTPSYARRVLRIAREQQPAPRPRAAAPTTVS